MNEIVNARGQRSAASATERPTLKLQPRREMSRVEWQRQAAIKIRIEGRHYSNEILRPQKFMFEYLADEYIVPEDLARTAFLAGLDDRKRGVPCICHQCSFASGRIGGNEMRRQAYAAKRSAELAAQGLSEDEVRRRVAVEIDFGAAL